MENFIIYDIEQYDIDNQYLLVRLITNINQPNECIFNLATIEGVNQLQIENNVD